MFWKMSSAPERGARASSTRVQASRRPKTRHATHGDPQGRQNPFAPPSAHARARYAREERERESHIGAHLMPSEKWRDLRMAMTLDALRVHASSLGVDSTALEHASAGGPTTREQKVAVIELHEAEARRRASCNPYCHNRRL